MLKKTEFEKREMLIMHKKVFTVFGDSISVQYTPYLKEELQEFEFVPKVEGKEAYEDLDIPKGTNCGDSKMLLEYISAAEKDGKLDKDLYLVNAGLHDIRIDPSTGRRQVEDTDYRKNLTDILTLLLGHGARVIFINTTNADEAVHNVRISKFWRYSKDVQAVNRIAAEVCEECGVALIDLYTFTLQFGKEGYADHIHYTSEIAKKQADFIAGEVRELWNKE